VLRHTINQLFASAQHLLLLIIGLHVSTDHSVIFRSLICSKFQGAVHTFAIPVVFTLKLNHSLAYSGFNFNSLRICMGLVLMYLQLILNPYANEWFSSNVNTIGIPNVCTPP
jgi:hypothetical protein